MASTDGPIPQKRVEVFTPTPNYVGHAAKVFAIHMGILLVGCILIGIFWDMTAMWVCGCTLTFFMVGWHLNNLSRAIDKENNFDNRSCKYVDY